MNCWLRRQIWLGLRWDSVVFMFMTIFLFNTVILNHLFFLFLKRCKKKCNASNILYFGLSCIWSVILWIAAENRSSGSCVAPLSAPPSSFPSSLLLSLRLVFPRICSGMFVRKPPACACEGNGALRPQVSLLLLLYEGCYACMHACVQSYYGLIVPANFFFFFFLRLCVFVWLPGRNVTQGYRKLFGILDEQT